MAMRGLARATGCSEDLRPSPIPHGLEVDQKRGWRDRCRFSNAGTFSRVGAGQQGRCRLDRARVRQHGFPHDSLSSTTSGAIFFAVSSTRCCFGIGKPPACRSLPSHFAFSLKNTMVLRQSRNPSLPESTPERPIDGGRGPRGRRRGRGSSPSGRHILACEKRHAWAIPVVYRIGATDRDRSSAQAHSPDPLLDGIAG